jgi:hypothetical protein
MLPLDDAWLPPVPEPVRTPAPPKAQPSRPPEWKTRLDDARRHLQASKRALADAILGQDQGVLSQIGRAELELLLG